MRQPLIRLANKFTKSVPLAGTNVNETRGNTMIFVKYHGVTKRCKLRSKQIRNLKNTRLNLVFEFL